MLVRITFPRLPQYIAALTSSIALLTVGTLAGWTGNTIDVLLAGQYNNIPINLNFLSWIVALPNLGSMFFALPSGILCDQVGRKTALLILTIPVAAGWLMILCTSSIDILLIGRFLIGMASGSFYVLVPLYASEIGEKEIRGKLASFFQLFLNIGILMSYVLGHVVHIKVFTVVCAVVPVIFFVAFLFQVESPIFKVKQKNYEEAKVILRYLRGESYDVDTELEEIKMSLEAKKNNTSIKKYWEKRSTRIALLVSLSLAFFQQAGGSSVVIFYTIEIFASAGSTLDPKEATIVIGVLRVLSALASSAIIDLFPRRIVLFVSSLLSALGLIILGVYYTLKDRDVASEETISTFGMMPVVGFSIYTIMTSFGISAMPAIITSELYPPEIKGFGISIMGTFSWFLLFLITRFYSDLKSAIGGDGIFYLFAVGCLASALFAVFVVPETKGKSLDQIQYDLNKQNRTSEN